MGSAWREADALFVLEERGKKAAYSLEARLNGGDVPSSDDGFEEKEASERRPSCLTAREERDGSRWRKGSDRMGRSLIYNYYELACPWGAGMPMGSWHAPKTVRVRVQFEDPSIFRISLSISIASISSSLAPCIPLDDPSPFRA